MTLQFQKLCSYQLHTADNERESHLYFARYGFHQALGFCFMWCVALPYSQVPRFFHHCFLALLFLILRVKATDSQNDNQETIPGCKNATRKCCHLFPARWRFACIHTVE